MYKVIHYILKLIRLAVVCSVFTFFAGRSMDSGKQHKRDILITFDYIGKQLKDISYSGLCSDESLNSYIFVNSDYFFTDYLLKVEYRKSISIIEDFLKAKELFLHESDDIVSKCGVTMYVQEGFKKKRSIAYVLLFLQEGFDDEISTVQVFKLGQKDSCFSVRVSSGVHAYKISDERFITFASDSFIELFDLHTGREMMTIPTFEKISRAGVFTRDRIGSKIKDDYFFILNKERTGVRLYKLNSLDPLFEKQFNCKIKSFDVRFDEGDYLVSVDLLNEKRYRYEL